MSIIDRMCQRIKKESQSSRGVGTSQPIHTIVTSSFIHQHVTYIPNGQNTNNYNINQPMTLNNVHSLNLIPVSPRCFHYVRACIRCHWQLPLNTLPTNKQTETNMQTTIIVQTIITKTNSNEYKISLIYEHI